MEREMCVYLEWNLNVQGDEIVDFEALIRSEHGSKALAASSPSPGPTSVLPVNAYPTPGMTRDRSQPIQQVPSPYMSRPQQVVQSQISLPSPPVSSAHHLLSSALTPQPPHFATAIASLASSPVSDDCRTPPAITVITAACRSMKSRSLAHHTRPIFNCMPSASPCDRGGLSMTTCTRDNHNWIYGLFVFLSSQLS
jgi:hypothetical protein